MKKKSIKILVMIFILLLIGIVTCKEIYDNRVIFPDKESEQIIRNIVKNHNVITDKDNTIVDDFNNAIEAFGGIEIIELNDKNIQMKEGSFKLSRYVQWYRLTSNPQFESQEEYYNYMVQNYKYYNEEELETNLLIFNYKFNQNVSVDDIKEYVDNGYRKNEDIIWKYIDWYGNVGDGLMSRYRDTYNLNYTDKYDGRLFFDLTLVEKIEVLNYLYENKLVIGG